jgi:hypothetical protein
MTVTVDTPLLDSLISPSAHRARLEEISMRAEELMKPYVPVRDNTLRPSVMASDFASGMLTWNTPYAAKQYHVPMNHSEAGTQDHWDEAMKRNDMPLLEDYVAKVYEEVF